MSLQLKVFNFRYGYKDLGVTKFEFVAKTPLPSNWSLQMFESNGYILKILGVIKAIFIFSSNSPTWVQNHSWI